MKAVKFQHRVATGHSILGKPFSVESKDPVSGEKLKTQYRQHKPVPTELVIEDALVLQSLPAAEGEEPRVTLLYRNGNAIMGGDWHNAVTVEHDVPHVGAEGAEESERFYVENDGGESSHLRELIAALRTENESLKAELAETTEGKDKALQALADEMAATSKAPDASADADVATLLDGSLGAQLDDSPAPSA